MSTIEISWYEFSTFCAKFTKTHHTIDILLFYRVLVVHRLTLINKRLNASKVVTSLLISHEYLNVFRFVANVNT